MRFSLFLLFVLFSVVCPGLVAAAEPAPPSAEALDFFEKSVRPVLVEACFKCHIAGQKVKGGLTLDSRDAILRGGDTGPALVPGEPDKSLLIKAVRQTDGELKMPPGGKKLPPEQVQALEAWVKMGAPFSASGRKTLSPFETLLERAKTHWSYQPLKAPAVPPPGAAWGQAPIDAFVLAKLAAAGMAPAPAADRRTLIRRATFDLTGLPPSPEEVAAFIADPAPEAFSHLVDRLLASPAYGERWGRHWLDVARYADNMGSIFNGASDYPFAYSYRDYVIRSFNEDKPYARFVVEQLAADRLGLAAGDANLAALGFITVGRRPNGGVDDDVLDDRLDVVGRGLMGMTIGCARCHDHKVEAIPTKDYYALYGVFHSVTEPAELPELVQNPGPAYAAYRAEKERLQNASADTLANHAEEALAAFRAQSADYLVAVAESRAKERGIVDLQILGPKKLKRFVFERWEQGLKGPWAQNHKDIFGPWRAFAALPDADFATRAKELAEQFAANKDSHPLNPQIAGLFAAGPPENVPALARRYGELFAKIEQAWQQRDKNGPAALADADLEAVRQVLIAKDAPTTIEPATIKQANLFEPKAASEVNKAEQALKDVEKHPGAPPRAMVVADLPRPFQPHIFVRGNPRNQGPAVPRQFFQILSGPDRRPFPEKSSGRLELAPAIASSDNPLTARVLVNRVWLHHFGSGLVRTPSDFGFRGESPTHPELLDYLAARFVADGWSIKALHRLIMNSSAYQMASDYRAECAKSDPENRLLWRFCARPLELEPFRDALLAVSGNLDPTLGGRPILLTAPTAPPRRTVYGFVDRKVLPGLYRNFDFPDPNYSNGERTHTALTPQALFLMNSPFMTDCARRLVVHARNRAGETAPPAELVRALYQLAYQRDPSPIEQQRAVAFVEKFVPEGAKGELNSWEAMAQVLLLSNEFAFVE